MTPLLMTTAEAAQTLGLTEGYLKRGAAARSIPHTRVGRYVRFSQADLAAIIAAGQVSPIVSPLRRRRAS